MRTLSPLLRLWLSLVPLLVACGPKEVSLPPEEKSDAGTKVERGPKTVPLEGDPNGLWWDAATSTLYLADDNNNRILKWTDEGGISVVAALPRAPANGPGLGQLVLTKNGTIVVVRFGGGAPPEMWCSYDRTGPPRSFRACRSTDDASASP